MSIVKFSEYIKVLRRQGCSTIEEAYNGIKEDNSSANIEEVRKDLFLMGGLGVIKILEDHHPVKFEAYTPEEEHAREVAMQHKIAQRR